jgi:hypothetical protein
MQEDTTISIDAEALAALGFGCVAILVMPTTMAPLLCVTVAG